MKEICTSPATEPAQSALERQEHKYNSRSPLIAKFWRANRQRAISFFGYPPEIRKLIYTTTAVGSLKMCLRHVTKTQGAFLHDEAVFKIFRLALLDIGKT
ncbi:MAG: transposase [Desulfovibrio sp.]|nr:transposase [Desulfovibrio sp.]